MGGFLNGIWAENPGGRYHNRYDAGRGIAAAFAEQIKAIKGKGVAAGLLRGGVEVAAAVANDLGLPLDFRAVRKVGHPMQPEFAIGAVDISGIAVKNPYLGVGEMPPIDQFDRMVEQALERAKEMEKELRGDRKSAIDDADWVLVCDDGAATGLTILAVVQGLKSEGKRVYVAVPVSSEQAARLISDAADDFFALQVPSYFMAVGQFYEDFSPVETSSVKKILGV